MTLGAAVDSLLLSDSLVALDGDGVVGFGGQLLCKIDRVRSLVQSLSSTDKRYRFPAVETGSLLERTRYRHNFPRLTARLDVGEAREEELWMRPSACHSLYPMLGGVDLPEPDEWCVEAPCFRSEGLLRSGRLTAFSMVEVVHVGTAASSEEFCLASVERFGAAFAELGLVVDTRPASDPFFGRFGSMIGELQVAQKSKMEFIWQDAEGFELALGSVNAHGGVFADEFGIRASGVPAATACVGVGVERVALAMVASELDSL